MYYLYQLGKDMLNIHIIYSKQNRFIKMNSLIKNSNNNMSGEIYSYIRRTGSDNLDLYKCVSINDYHMYSNAETLEEAKLYKIKNERNLKDNYISIYDKEIAKLIEHNNKLNNPTRKRNKEKNEAVNIIINNNKERLVLIKERVRLLQM